jgi:hypothetical protein
MDRPWWDVYHDDVIKNFRGLLFTASRFCYTAEYSRAPHFGNTGAAMMSHAFVYHGARRIVMLGYDSGPDNNGKTHHHGSHPVGLGDAGSYKDWPGQFDELSKWLAMNQVAIFNCSRKTRLTCFPRADLDSVIEKLSGSNHVYN